jgi:DNA (cytosine-5)-methyltransferase 1
MTTSIASKFSDIGPLLPRHPFKDQGPIEWNLAEYLEKNAARSSTSLVGTEITDEQQIALNVWNEFVKRNLKENAEPLPGLPLWTEYWKPRNEIHLSKSLPDWKRRFIERNSEFYLNNRKWIDSWLRESNLNELIPSYRKFEWQAQDQRNIKNCIVQFRPSGIRVKAPTYVPTFVAMAQTPVLAWEKRSLGIAEAKVLQGFPKSFNFGDQRDSLSFKQIGNAVHVGVASLVFQSLIKRARQLDQPWASQVKIKNSQMTLLPVPDWNK